MIYHSELINLWVNGGIMGNIILFTLQVIVMIPICLSIHFILNGK